MIANNTPNAWTAPCGAKFDTLQEAKNHEWNCDQRAGVIEPINAALRGVLEAYMRRHPAGKR